MNIAKDESSGFIGSRRFRFSILIFENSQKHNFQIRLGTSFYFVKWNGGPEVMNNRFWESWTCTVGPQILNMMTVHIFTKIIQEITKPK